MKPGFDMRHRYRRGMLLGAGLLALALLPGCGDTYSDAVVYELRHDPLFREKAPTLPAESPFQYKADPPGQLPLLKMAAVKDHRNPFNPELFLNKQEIDQAVDKAKERQKQLDAFYALFIDPTQVRAEEKKVLRDALGKMFGTPAKPRVNIPDVNPEHIDELKLDRTSLAMGSKLYRLHCLTCHGVSGDGRGPTAQWVNPHPRDYRAGLFKFQSVDGTKGEVKKPMREDLFHTLYYGVEATSMPAFNLLTHDDLEALVSYVMHLSIRGELEMQFYRGLSVDTASKQLVTTETAEQQQGKLEILAKKLVAAWKDSQTAGIKVDPYPFKADDDAGKKTSILRGQAMFLANVDMLKKVFPKKDFVKKYKERFGGNLDSVVSQGDYDKEIKKFADSVSCVTCHGDFGRQIVFKFDDWGTLVKPANLTIPVYRGGRRPVDLYYRIHSGINGSGMLNFGSMLKSEQVWDLVNFVQILPYPAMRAKYGVNID